MRVTVDNDISGTGTLTKAGAGTTTLTGANTYSGTTTISAGTLQVGNGGTSGRLGTGNVVNNAALVINRSDAVTRRAVISGTGTLTQVGHRHDHADREPTHTAGRPRSAQERCRSAPAARPGSWARAPS